MKKTYLISYLIFFLLISNHSFSQINFLKNDSIIVIKDGTILKNPWAGGLNFIQASKIDLNLDGIEDLFLFDRTGDKINTFINSGMADSTNYKADNSFRNKFPKLSSWALLRDYNNDNKKDIFTYTPGGFCVYKNIGNAQTGLNFELASVKVYSNYYSDYIPLYVTSVDIPSIDDIDNDGDLDVLTYSTNSVYVEYHQNRSMDLFGNPDSLDSFYLTTGCWGKFKENEFNCEITLNDPCTNRNETQTQHSGSSLNTLDIDGDGDKDVLIGDISCTTNTLIINGGNSQIADGISQTHEIPNATDYININNFPTSYHLDVNNDGKRDLLVSPNVSNSGENTKSVWYYKNVGSDAIPNFKKINENFLQGSMIDVGEGNYPILEDLNNDGLLDLLISSYGYYSIGGNILSKISFYKNIGTQNQAKFEFVTDDYQNFSTLNMKGLYPSFGDLDGDGDKDLIFGNDDGKLIYFRNEGSNNSPSFILIDSFYQGIDVGNFATPQLYDVNNDLLLDLVIGEERGNVNYIQNSGSPTNPIFDVSTIDVMWGNVDISEYIPNGLAFGYSTPKVFKKNGEMFLISGTKLGYIYLYNSIDGNINGTFNLVDSTLSDIWEGIRSVPEIADINNDGNPDLFIGNYGGGLGFYSFDVSSSINKTNDVFYLNIFPNPSKNNISILNENIKNKIYSIQFIDLQGRLVYCLQQNLKQKPLVDVSTISNGYYLVRIISNNENYYAKFVKE